MPKRVDAEAQRRAFAGAALAVINASGLEGARLRDVARAANATTGAVTHYFDGKDAVLEAALEEIVHRTLARQDRAPERTDVRTFVAQAGAYLPIDEESRAEWRVWLAFWGRAITDERLRARHQRYYAAIVDRLVERLPALRGGKAASRAQLRQLADAVVAAIDGVGTRATLEPGSWPAKRQRDTLAALLTPLLAEFSEGA